MCVSVFACVRSESKSKTAPISRICSASRRFGGPTAALPVRPPGTPLHLPFACYSTVHL